jgi:tetratricopeptide (TPR) repeat protein
MIVAQAGTLLNAAYGPSCIRDIVRFVFSNFPLVVSEPDATVSMRQFTYRAPPMYRRNIKHILLLLVGVIGIFVLYHAWVKPNYFPDPPPSPPKVVSEDHASAPESSVAPQQAASEAKRPRTLDPVTIPVPKHSELLGSIHEELEKRNLSVAETKLAEVPSSMLAESATRRHVAILWNNLGILQEQDGGTEASVKAFKKAVTLDPQNAVAYLNLAHAYWGLRDPALTQDFLHKVSTLAPEEPFPHLALADLLQEQDMIKEASRHLSEAKARIKKDPGLQSYLTSVTMKVQRTEKIEDKLSAHSTVHFTVKYDGNEDPATWILVLDILEEAYREIGQKFNHFPSRPMIVVLQLTAYLTLFSIASTSQHKVPRRTEHGSRESSATNSSMRSFRTNWEPRAARYPPG